MPRSSPDFTGVAPGSASHLSHVFHECVHKISVETLIALHGFKYAASRLRSKPKSGLALKELLDDAGCLYDVCEVLRGHLERTAAVEAFMMQCSNQFDDFGQRRGLFLENFLGKLDMPDRNESILLFGQLIVLKE